jgi:hypothetical protein
MVKIDLDIVAYFEGIIGTRDYEKVVNDALREIMNKEQFIQTLREVLREELDSKKKKK